MSSPTIVSTTVSSSPKLTDCIRDSEFWFSDGDIVLAVKSAGAETAHLFRVHKPLLELHSSVFRTALSDNNSSTTTTDRKSFYDGARAIWVPETSHNALEYFLRFLYNPYTDIPIRTLNDTELCDGFIKLCNELDARTMCIPMLKRLYSIWPPTLAAWDNVDAQILASAKEYPKMGKNSQGKMMMLFHDDMFPEPASTIRLGRTYNLHSILPAALYHLSRIDPTSDYYKMHMEPTRSNVDSQQRLHAGLRSARWSLLTAKDHYALAGFKDHVQGCLANLMTESSSHLACRSEMEKTYLDIVRSSLATRNVLHELKIGFDDPQHICNSCVMHGKKVTSLMRRNIWDQLAIILRACA